jgi:hypothetical protein
MLSSSLDVFCEPKLPPVFDEAHLKFEALLKTLSRQKMPGARPGIPFLSACAVVDR